MAPAAIGSARRAFPSPIAPTRRRSCSRSPRRAPSCGSRRWQRPAESASRSGPLGRRARNRRRKAAESRPARMAPARRGGRPRRINQRHGGADREAAHRSTRAARGGVAQGIRAPLARLRMLVEMLRGRAADDGTIGKLEREIVEIDSLVGDLLASSRLELSMFAFRKLDAGELAAEALDRAGLPPGLLRVPARVRPRIRRRRDSGSQGAGQSAGQRRSTRRRREGTTHSRGRPNIRGHGGHRRRDRLRRRHAAAGVDDPFSEGASNGEGQARSAWGLHSCVASPRLTVARHGRRTAPRAEPRSFSGSREMPQALADTWVISSTSSSARRAITGTG